MGDRDFRQHYRSYSRSNLVTELQAEAVAEWQKAMTLAGDNELAGTLGSLYAKGRLRCRDAAVTQKKLDRLTQRTERGEYVPSISYARAYVRLDDKERVFQSLREASEERNVFALLLNSDPFYGSLREDPRFPAIFQSNVLQQSRFSGSPN